MKEGIALLEISPATHFVRQLGSGYCSTGCTAILVSFVDSKTEVDQKELVKNFAPNFEDWGVTNDQTVQMIKKYFGSISQGENTTWQEASEKLKSGWAMVIDFMDNTAYTDGSPSQPEGHSIVIIKIDLIRQTAQIIDPAHKEKSFVYKGIEYRIYDTVAEVPLKWLDEQWYDEDIKGKKVCRWAMFAELSSYRQPAAL